MRTSGSGRRSQLHRLRHRRCRRHQIRVLAHLKAPVPRAALQPGRARPQQDAKPTEAARVASRRPTALSLRVRRGRRTSNARLLVSAGPPPSGRRPLSTRQETGGSLQTVEPSTDASASDQTRLPTASRTVARSHDPGRRLELLQPPPLFRHHQCTLRTTLQSLRHHRQYHVLASPPTGFHPNPHSPRQKTQTGTTSFFQRSRKSLVFRHFRTLDTAATSPSLVPSRSARVARVERQGKMTSPSNGIGMDSPSGGRSSSRKRSEKTSKCRRCGRVWLRRANLGPCPLSLRSHQHRQRCPHLLLPATLISPMTPATDDRPMLSYSSLPPTRSIITSLLVRWSALAPLLFLLSSR